VKGATGITADGKGGSDTATLMDSAGVDMLTASPTEATLSDGATYDNEAKGFAVVYAYSSGGSDTATLSGNPDAANRFEGRPGSASLAGAGYYDYLAGFARVFADLSGGTAANEAFLYDSAGNGTFWGHLADAVLSDGTLDLTTGNLTAANNYYLRVSGYNLAADQVNVSGWAGGTSERHVINPVDYALAFNGTWLDI
jgi:hypothetical protein